MGDCKQEIQGSPHTPDGPLTAGLKGGIAWSLGSDGWRNCSCYWAELQGGRRWWRSSEIDAIMEALEGRHRLFFVNNVRGSITVPPAAGTAHGGRPSRRNSWQRRADVGRTTLLRAKSKGCLIFLVEDGLR